MATFKLCALLAYDHDALIYTLFLGTRCHVYPPRIRGLETNVYWFLVSLFGERA
jgi:hypothetical protein